MEFDVLVSEETRGKFDDELFNPAWPDLDRPSSLPFVPNIPKPDMLEVFLNSEFSTGLSCPKPSSLG